MQIGAGFFAVLVRAVLVFLAASIQIDGFLQIVERHFHKRRILNQRFRNRHLVFRQFGIVRHDPVVLLLN